MKLFIYVALFFWLLCGFVGAFWDNDFRAVTIARGPLSLVEAINEDPVSYPGP